jgi:hypothetical protein
MPHEVRRLTHDVGAGGVTQPLDIFGGEDADRLGNVAQAFGALARCDENFVDERRVGLLRSCRRNPRHCNARRKRVK